jgi:signal transduction histidine kinase/ActR/RegA family two-component response regulator
VRTTSVPGSSQDRASLGWLRVVAVSALVVPALIFAAVAAYMYRQEFTAAQDSLDGAARVAHEQALKLFETNEMLLERMLDLLGDMSDAQILARGEEMHQRLKAMAADLPQVQGLFINGANGRMLANSRVYPPPREIDYTDREWFGWHRSEERGAYLSEQLTSRATGEPFFDMSRRRSRATGAFGGTVHVSLRPEYLTDFYRQLESSTGDLRFLVLRSDGHLVARWPGTVKPGARVPAQAPLMRSIAGGGTEGEYAGRSLLDDVERIGFWRRLGKYPLYVAVGMDRTDVVAAWYRRIAVLALFAFPLAAGFAWMTLYALRRAREELDAARRLEDETRRRERIELSLMKSQKLEAMGRLAGGVAHDFNNLLMVISNNVHLLRYASPELADNAQLAAISRAVGSGANLTRQMLSFSRQQALLPQRLLLQERVPAILDLLRPLLGHSIELSGAVDDDTAAIEVDPAELELALINLAVNAKDAMPEGGRLEISVGNAPAGEPGDPSGDFVLLEVADSGFGMDPAVVERAFDPFFTTKPVGYGTGLGLSQVQGLCQSAGGLARIESRPGLGTRVKLYFPARGRVGQAAAAESAPGLADVSCRLLLVEDNESVAEGTSQVLRSMACQVERVSDAATALSRLGSAGFNLVLSDIEMPGELDGIGLAAKLAETRPDLPVILMTGYASRLEQAKRQNFAVLPKPCSPAMLAEAIRKALAPERAAATLAR